MGLRTIIFSILTVTGTSFVGTTFAQVTVNIVIDDITASVNNYSDDRWYAGLHNGYPTIVSLREGRDTAPKDLQSVAASLLGGLIVIAKDAGEGGYGKYDDVSKASQLLEELFKAARERSIRFSLDFGGRDLLFSALDTLLVGVEKILKAKGEILLSNRVTQDHLIGLADAASQVAVLPEKLGFLDYYIDNEDATFKRLHTIANIYKLVENDRKLAKANFEDAGLLILGNWGIVGIRSVDGAESYQPLVDGATQRYCTILKASPQACERLGLWTKFPSWFSRNVTCQL